MTFDTEDLSEVESYKSDPGSSNDDDPLWADDPEKAYLKSMLNDNDDGPGDSLIGESTLGDIMGNGDDDDDDDDNTDNNTIPTRDTYGYTPRSRDTYGFSPQSNKAEDDSYGFTPQKDHQKVQGEEEEEEKKEEGQQQVDSTIISPVKQSKSIVVGEIVLPSSGLTLTDNDTLDNITAADNDTLDNITADNLTADTGLQYQYHQQILQRQLQQPPPGTVLSSVDDNDPEAALARVYNQQGDPGQQDIPPPVAMIPRTPENFKTRPYHSSRELPVVKVDEELPPAGNGVAGVPPNGVAPPSFIFVTPGHSSAVKTKERPSATGGGGGGNGTAARLKKENWKNKSSSGPGGGGPPQDSNNKKNTGGGEKPREKKDPTDAAAGGAVSNNRRGTLSGRFYCRVAIVFLLLAVIISMVLLVLVLSEKLNDGSDDPTSIEDGSGGENNNPNAWPTIPPDYTFPPATFEPTGPTEAPTITREPSSEPTGSPSTSPTNPPPTLNPTNPPVIGPTESPTKNPTDFPSLSPTNEPSLSPTDTPTSIPTQNPSENPTTLSPTRTISPTDDLLNEAITGLVEVSPESEIALSDETSPQYRALEWAIQDSQLRSPPITTNARTDGGGGRLRQRQRDLRRRPRRNLQEDTQFIQRWVLATFYYSTNGDNWDDNTSWLSSDDECTWYEVSCNGENEISSLTLRENNLFGPIPLELHLLSNSLEFLHLNSNDLTGGVPTTFGRLINLERISLTLNQLSGSVPSELGGMASLRLFGLGRNDLSGPLPPELGNLENLESFDLSVNNVQGTIPTEYGELSLLETLKLHRNAINGQLPSELGNLRRLKSFEADRNSIGGTIPSEFGGMYDLESLILNDNEISGEIPETLGDLENLEVLDVSENTLSGVVPEPVCELPMAEITADCEEVTCTCCDICCVDGDGCKENDQTPIQTPLPATPPPTTPAPTQSPPSTCVAEVSTNKDCYENGDDIVVSFTVCDVDESDFVGVYQARTDTSDLDDPIAFRYVCEDQDCDDGEVKSGTVRFNNARGRGSFIIILVREDDDEALAVGNEFSLAEDSC